MPTLTPPRFPCFFVLSNADAASAHAALSFGYVQNSSDPGHCYVDGVKTKLSALVEAGRIDAAAAAVIAAHPSVREAAQYAPVIELPKLVTEAPEITAARALVEALGAKDHSPAGLARIAAAFSAAVRAVE
jgi:hypothetical protein